MRGFIRRRCRCRRAESIMHAFALGHRALISDVTRGCFLFSGENPWDESGCAAPSVFAYRYDEITMACGTLVDIG